MYFGCVRVECHKDVRVDSNIHREMPWWKCADLLTNHYERSMRTNLEQKHF